MTKALHKPAIKDLDLKALDALIGRVTEAKEHDLALSADDCQLLLDALLTLVSMQERLGSKDITIAKLRKLTGIVASSETLTGQLTRSSNAKDQKKSRKNKPKTPKTKLKPEVKHHSLDGLSKGDECPECETGKLYKYDPATLLRITGQSPFVPEQHVMERLRCNTCGVYFTAAVPEAVLADGERQQKYGYSARSLMGISKYYAGSPFYRQGSLQDLLGVSISASSIFDQTEHLSNHLFPVFKQLLRHAANAKHYYMDDTTHRILDQKPVMKKQRKGKKERLRSGVYTSGVIATSLDDHPIILFETNIGHAGEFIDSLLSQRDESLPPPLIMSDALTSNRPTVVKSTQSLCNAHGRRQFYDVLSHFTDEVEEVLCLYGQIWVLDDQAAEQQLTPTKRLAYHQKHSLPIMERIKRWGEAHLQNETVEENSGLGEAIRYFNKHYKGLTRFCEIEGAQLDNNRMEAQLKLVVRDRKNAMFHKTLAGAAIGDVITSMIATASQVNINVFEYFNWLQQAHKKVVLDPEYYLPWNYLKNHVESSF
ncbi:hypothetical protein MNBD_GAMMA10-529 [hydrothermal vent metagenome]|uniref:Transposase IS66 central domain-containing protein n=1 Tax=hydrothermal vent metagenome TaxID=652676 RepID=A0A3B0XA70_9ZZZZ